MKSEKKKKMNKNMNIKKQKMAEQNIVAQKRKAQKSQSITADVSDRPPGRTDGLGARQWTGTTIR